MHLISGHTQVQTINKSRNWNIDFTTLLNIKNMFCDYNDVCMCLPYCCRQRKKKKYEKINKKRDLPVMKNTKASKELT